MFTNDVINLDTSDDARRWIMEPEGDRIAFRTIGAHGAARVARVPRMYSMGMEWEASVCQLNREGTLDWKALSRHDFHREATEAAEFALDKLDGV